MTTGHEPGSRVFAVLAANQEEIQLLGFGTYMGDEVRPGGDQFSQADLDMAINVIKEGEKRPLDIKVMYDTLVERGELTREQADRECAAGEARAAKDRERPIEERAKELLLRMARNPKIELDNGDVVWGYQCWWGPEERWPEIAKGRTVHDVRIGDALRDHGMDAEATNQEA